MKGTGNLSVVPEIGNGIDLAELAEAKKPARIKVLTLPVKAGTLVVDRRLGPPPVTPDGSRLLWLLPEEAVADIEKEWPVIWPHYEDEPF